tara:strand:+ start:1475 stop:1699 length:225 start_codon:yes stop_codon:yes gene_type:complete
VTLPKNLNGKELVKVLQKLGYEQSRQVGSHIRLTTYQEGTHHITIPNHRPIKIGTLSAILKDVGNHFGKSKDEI